MDKLPEWNPAILFQSPIFEPLHPVLTRLRAKDFPLLSDLNALIEEHVPAIKVQNGMPLRFVKQERGKLPFKSQYEPRCYLYGQVQTRENNWHDIFNALVWLTFPKAKAAINARHYNAMAHMPEPDDGRRGSLRDTLTLLDESGMLVVCSDPDLANLLQEFRWKELFWHRRDRLAGSMGFYLFGHSLYEKALSPYIGMTGKGLLLPVKQEFFGWPWHQKLAYLDQQLFEYLVRPENCQNPRELIPVPLLGIPGWSNESSSQFFYDNSRYFRAGRLLYK